MLYYINIRRERAAEFWYLRRAPAPGAMPTCVARRCAGSLRIHRLAASL